MHLNWAKQPEVSWWTNQPCLHLRIKDFTGQPEPEMNSNLTLLDPHAGGKLIPTVYTLKLWGQLLNRRLNEFR